MGEKRREEAAMQRETVRANTRIRIVFGIACGVTLLILLKIVFLAVSRRHYRDMLRGQSVIGETLVIPGCRGKLLAPDGSVIAHSERRLDIFWNVPENFNVAELSWRDLSEVPFMKLPDHGQLEVLLAGRIRIAHDLPVDDGDVWNVIFSNGQLHPRVFFKRVTTDAPQWRNIAGQTMVDASSGIERGVSGLEKLYDERLRAGTVQCRLLRDQRRLILDRRKAEGRSVIVNASMP